MAMSMFTKFELLPLELQDMIWRFALPEPRVVEYNSASETGRLIPFAPALHSVCRRSQFWTLKTFRPVLSPKDNQRTIGYMDFTCDTLLLKDVREEIFKDESEGGVDHEIAFRMDKLISQSITNTHGNWNHLKFLAISVPVFLVTLWSGGERGPYHREQSSPILNNIYGLPSLLGIAIVSTGAKEIDIPYVNRELSPSMMEANWDSRSVWRFLTENEAKAGWAKLFKENLCENFGLGKEDGEEGSAESWEEVTRSVWNGNGPEVVHIGLETVQTRMEMKGPDFDIWRRGLRRSERLKAKAGL